ncbi:MAG: circadian clock protein KaiC [Bacteroidota bacterium]
MKEKSTFEELKKIPSGIKGLDTITNGGLPKGRPCLVCGKAGTGKTILGIEFIVNGIRKFSEPGVIISFEERTADLMENVASLGMDLQKHVDDKMLAIDYVYIERNEIEETGIFNLDGLFIRVAEAVRMTGAKRILIDTLESLFSGFTNEQLLRAEIRRLFKWLKDKGLTAVITAEAGDNTLTRYGLEEYLSDFVLLLDSQIRDNVCTRRLRLVKYRGSKHGISVFPFLITDSGFSILPVTDVSLEYEAPVERLLTGIKMLDSLLEGGGIYRGSALLISGTPGCGKTSLTASILDAACMRGEKVFYISFEESKPHILRNMNSIGIDISKWLKKKLFHFENLRLVSYGIESLLVKLIDDLERVKPSLVAIDPLSSLLNLNMSLESRSLVLRILHYIQSKGITCVFTEMAYNYNEKSSTMNISSLMDFWIMLQHKEIDGKRKKTLNIVKARGMKHSDKTFELAMSDKGIELVELPVNVRIN